MLQLFLDLTGFLLLPVTIFTLKQGSVLRHTVSLMNSMYLI